MRSSDSCQTYAQLQRLRPLASRLRALARKGALFALSLPARIPRHGEWITFPYYHHVLDDERAGFDRQLRYLRRFGDFISLDEAVAALENPAGIGGRYFAVTFDDGFKSCLTGALPILIEHGCPAAFFLPTDYIGTDLDADRQLVARFFAASGLPVPFEFLSWDDCRQLRDAGMILGGHTAGHLRLAELDSAAVEAQLRESKARIEEQLGRPCHYFASPWGRPGIDFDPEVHPAMARRLGYRAFLTTRRGPNVAGTSPFNLRRDHAVARDGLFVLRYFFSRSAAS